MPLTANMHHGSRSGHESRLPDMVPLFFLYDDFLDELSELFIRSAASHQFVQIMLPNREQAGAQLAIGGDADAAAVATERMRHRGNDSNLAHAIGEAIAPSGFATLVRNLLQRHKLRHARKNLVQRDHNLRSPNPIFFERHKLDEAHYHLLFTGKLSEVCDLIFIEPAKQ